MGGGSRQYGGMRRFLAWTLRPRLWITLVVFGVSAIFVAAAIVLPGVVADFDEVSGDARVQDIASVRQAVLWIGGGLLAALTLLFTWRRDTLTRDANFTGRYTEAIAQLGDDSIAIRLGGVYALERIARDSPRDRGTILEVLTTYLRHHSPAPRPDEAREKLAVDVAAAALVVGRITQMSPPTIRVDLTHTNLRGADLTGANLYHARLGHSDLTRANLARAELSRAYLFGADLMGANLVDANLRLARAQSASFAGARMRRVSFRAAYLRNANLSHSVLVEANLSRADLSNADFTGADLSNADLTAARMTSAIFEKARGYKNPTLATDSEDQDSDATRGGIHDYFDRKDAKVADAEDAVAGDDLSTETAEGESPSDSPTGSPS